MRISFFIFNDMMKLDKYLTRSHLLLDSWDPDNSGLMLGIGNATFNMKKDKDGRITFEQGTMAPYHRYKNRTGENEDILDHIYFNTENGSVYYRDGQGNYVKHNETITPGFWKYASDDQINPIANNIIRSLRTAAKMKSDPAAQQTSQTIPVENPIYTQPTTQSEVDTKDPKKQEEDAKKAKKLEEHNAYVQQMLTQSQQPFSPAGSDNSTKDDTVYYNYGPDQIDLRHFIYNLGTNLQSYLNSKSNWSQAQKDAFMNSYNNYKSGLEEQFRTKGNRFSIDDRGYTRDNQSILGSDTHHVFITPDGKTYNSLDEIQDKKQRKHAIEFSPNDEVAVYMNKIGKAFVNQGKTKKSTEEATSSDFDFNQHGFQHFWANKINPSGGRIDLNPYLNLDMEDENGVRGTENRTKYLVNELTNYVNHVQNQNWNYNNSGFGSKEEYVNRLNAAIQNLQNGWDASDAATLQAAGISPDFYEGFFGTGMTPEEEEAKKEQEIQQKETDDIHNYWVGILNKHEQWANSNVNNYTEQNPHMIAPKNITTENYAPIMSNFLYNLGYQIDNSNSFNSIEDTEAAYSDLRDTTLRALKQGARQVSINGNAPMDISRITQYLIPAMIVDGDFQQDPETGLYFYDNPEDEVTGNILVYDGQKLYYTFINNIKGSQAFLNAKNNYYKDKQVVDGTRRFTFKEGGKVVQKAKNGSVLAELLVNPVQQRADANGRIYKQQNLKEREMNGTADIMNPENGNWKAEDYTRMASIGADVASLFMDPLSGTITNIGSTIGNFAADAMDDSVKASEMWKNLGANLGFDALSIIPVIGDAAGTGTKLVKSLKWAAPKLMYALSAYGVGATLKNAPNIMESLSKVMSDDKLNVGDYQNIAQAISAIVGGGNLMKNKKLQKSAQEQARATDSIGLTVVDEKGIKQNLIFKGDKATEIRKHVQSGDADALNKYLHTFENQNGLDFKNLNVSTSVNSIIPKTRKPWETITDADGKTSRKVRRPLEMDKKIDAFDVFNKKSSGLYTPDWLINRSKQNQKGIVETNPYTKTEVDAFQEKQVQDLTANAKKKFEKNKAVAEANENTINAHTKEFDDLQKVIRDNEAIVAANKKVIDETNALKAKGEYKGDEESLKTIIEQFNEANKKINDSKLRSDQLKKEIDDLRKANTKLLDPNNPTSEMKKLKKLLENPIEIFDDKGNKTGRQVRLDLKDVVQKYFKKGGRLQFLKQGDNLIGNIGHTDNYVYYTHGLSNWVQDLLDAAGSAENKEEFANGINDMQHRHSVLKSKWNGSQAYKGDADYDVQGYQNDIINNYNYVNTKGISNIRSNNYYVDSKNPYGNDSDKTGLWKADNYYAAQTDDRRVLGRNGDFTEDQFNELSNKFKNAGYRMYLDPEDDYYKLEVLPNDVDIPEIDQNELDLNDPGQITANQTNPNIESDPNINPNGTGYKQAGESRETDLKNKPFNKSLIEKKIQNQLPNLARLFHLDQINRAAKKIGQMSIDAEQLYLQEPVEHQRAEFGNYRAQQEGKAARAQGMSAVINNALTSDQQHNAAIISEEFDKTQSAVDNGDKIDDQTRRQTSEVAWLQKKENRNLRANMYNQNAASIAQYRSNVGNKKAAIAEKIAQNRKAFGDEMIYRLDNTIAEKKAIADNLDLNATQKDALYNPTNYGITWEGDEEEVYNQMIQGTKPTDPRLNANTVKRVHDKIAMAKENALRRYYGLPGTNMTLFPATQFQAVYSSPFDGFLKKSGGKITVAKIKEKMENAKRFLDSTNKERDRFTKKWIAKQNRLYGLPKVEIIKAK